MSSLQNRETVASDPGSCRTLVISDTHLGRSGPGALQAEQLRPLWQGVDRLIINGDVAEVQESGLRAEAAREIGRLQTLTEADGVELTLISGNHDAFLSDRRHLLLAGGRVFLTHGDVLHPAVAPWVPESRRAAAVTARAREQLGEAAFAQLHTRLEVSQHASLAGYQDQAQGGSTLRRLIFQPTLVPRVLAYWRVAPDLAAAFAVRYAARAQVVIFGHSHRPGIWRRAERWVINTGCFGFPGRPRAVLLKGDQIEVYPLMRQTAGYHLGNRVLRRIILQRQGDLVHAAG